MRWRVLGKPKAKEETKRQEEIFKILLKNRGLISQKQKQEFLNPPKPSSFSLKNLGISDFQVKKALIRLEKAIAQKEEIIVYGDYDADGICGTAILWEALNFVGAKVMPYIPERISEGYGLNIETIKNLKSKRPGLRLIVTVDQGITAHEKIDFAKNLGIEVIVTDHHEPAKTKPQAEAIIHTTLLSGAGVAWVMARELVKTLKKGKKLVSEQLELAAIGTITDLLPLLGPSRSFVKWGFRNLNQTQRTGLRSLFREAGIEKGKISTYEVGFIIGPRLNAAGRVEHALDSLRLLCTKNPQRGYDLAQKLGKINRQRQKLMEETTLQAREAWLAQKSQGAKIILVDGYEWEQGVIGLAASKLKEEFYLPVVIISRGQTQSKASARSINGFDMIGAIREADNLLIDSGGHPMAAGFTVATKNLNQLKQKLIDVAEQRLDIHLLEKTLKIDCQLDLEDLSFSFFNQLNKLAPFGVGNPQPDFVTRRLETVEARLVGKQSRHLKLLIRSPVSKITFPAIGFGMGEFYPQLSPDKKTDLAYSLIIDTWGGAKKLQLKVKDIKLI